MDTPKIEVTDANPSHELPLHAEFGEVGSEDWPDICYDSADYLGAQSIRPMQDDVQDSHGNPCSPHRRPFTKRSERGPGKSPSPSRNSPRRHSPVPYSPKRQHRAFSPVTLDDFYDVTLSPTRHSPVPCLVDGSHALSLTSDEFSCVSYSDPFSSPPRLHTSEDALAFSMECGPKMGSDQMEKIPDDDFNTTEVMGELDGKTSWLDTTCVAPGDRCLQDPLELVEEGDFQGTPEMVDSVAQDGDLFLYEVDEEQLPNKNRHCITDGDRGHFLAANCPNPNSFYDTELLSQNLCEESFSAGDEEYPEWKLNGCVRVGKVPMEDKQESFLDTTVVCSDSSSEDDMEEEQLTFQPGAVSTSQPHDTTNLSSGTELDHLLSQSHSDSRTPFAAPLTDAVSNGDSASQLGLESESSRLHLCREPGTPSSQHDGLGNSDCVVGDLTKDPGLRCSAPEKLFVEELTCDEPIWASSVDDKRIPFKGDSHSPTITCPAMEAEWLLDLEEDESNDSTDLSILQHFSNEYHSSSYIFPSDMTSSLYSQHASESSVSESTNSVLDMFAGKTTGQLVSKTPEDFALSRLVGCPPLQFPHCQNMMLIHRALSNPYDPDLPTPPIVVTFHDIRYNFPLTSADIAFEASTRPQSSSTVFSHCNRGGHPEGCHQRADISKSESCPNLHHTDKTQFQEPGQIWSFGSQSQHRHDNEISAYIQEEVKWGFRSGFYSSEAHPVLRSSERDVDTSSVVSCFGASSSPCNSRAAVIDRLRRVVERRMSGSLDSLETSLHEG